MKLANVSFSDKGWKEFTKLKKEEQVKKLESLLSPKDTKYAEKLLKDVPNGDKFQGGIKKVKIDKPERTGEAGGELRDSRPEHQEGEDSGT